MSARRQFLRARTFGPALALVLGACPSDDDLAIMTSATEGPATSTGSTSTSTGSSPMTTLLPPATETTDPTSTGGTTELEDTTSTSTTATVSTTENSTTDSDTCGDGDLDPGEGCDLGSDNDNNGACTKLCQLPECGDGLEQPGEACDLGPANHPNEYNGCTPEFATRVPSTRIRESTGCASLCAADVSPSLSQARKTWPFLVSPAAPARL